MDICLTVRIKIVGLLLFNSCAHQVRPLCYTCSFTLLTRHNGNRRQTCANSAEGCVDDVCAQTSPGHVAGPEALQGCQQVTLWACRQVDLLGYRLQHSAQCAGSPTWEGLHSLHLYWPTIAFQSQPFILEQLHVLNDSWLTVRSTSDREVSAAVLSQVGSVPWHCSSSVMHVMQL